MRACPSSFSVPCCDRCRRPNSCRPSAQQGKHPVQVLGAARQRSLGAPALRTLVPEPGAHPLELGHRHGIEEHRTAAAADTAAGMAVGVAAVGAVAAEVAAAGRTAAQPGRSYDWGRWGRSPRPGRGHGTASSRPWWKLELEDRGVGRRAIKRPYAEWRAVDRREWGDKSQARIGVAAGDVRVNNDHKPWQLVVIASCSRVGIVVNGPRHKRTDRAVGCSSMPRGLFGGCSNARRTFRPSSDWQWQPASVRVQRRICTVSRHCASSLQRSQR